MGGFIIDVIIGYLCRSLARVFRNLRSRRWPLAKATVEGASWSAGGFGCANAELIYTYDIDGRVFGAVDDRPFLWSFSAEDYVKKLPKGKTIWIRVSPDNPNKTFVQNAV